VMPAQPVDITPVAPARPKPADGETEGPADSEESATPAPSAVVSWPLFVLPVTIRASGSFADMEDFMRAVQADQPRAILFTSFTLAPDETGQTFADHVVLVAETRVFVGPVVAADVGAPAAG